MGNGYADNREPLTKDEPLVAALFPEPNVTLLSPAFISPDTVPEGFASNLAPPTNSATLGQSTTAPSFNLRAII